MVMSNIWESTARKIAEKLYQTHADGAVAINDSRAAKLVRERHCHERETKLVLGDRLGTVDLTHHPTSARRSLEAAGAQQIIEHAVGHLQIHAARRCFEFMLHVFTVVIIRRACVGVRRLVVSLLRLSSPSADL